MNDKDRNSDAAVTSSASLGQVLGALALFILGVALAGFLVYNLARDVSLWVLGREATAEVLSLWVEPVEDVQEGEMSFRYYMEYQFETPGGRTITKTTRLDVREWGALEEGGPVRIVYFPLVPSHSRLEESRFVAALACAYLPLVVVAWALLGAAWYLIRPATERRWWFASSKED